MEKIIEMMSSQEIIKSDLENIYIGNLNTVDDDLHFPRKGKNGSDLIWSTNESRFIDDEGNVHRPLHGMGNRKVVIKVVATYKEKSEEREFVATVIQEAKETIVESVENIKLFAKLGEKKKLPPVVIVKCQDGRCMTMPVTWEEYEIKNEETTVMVEGKLNDSNKTVQAEIYYREKISKEYTPTKKIEFLSLSDVKLLEGSLYYEHQQLMLQYLLNCNDDQLLYNFRKAAGLDTLGAPAMTGWDEESCKLKGHTTGHYLSGLALAWGATKNKIILDKIVYVVDELKKCQDAFEASGKYHKGFLSAYSEEQFDLLEQFVKYPDIWAPYYTLDKIMSGLYDCYVIANIEEAKEILVKMGDWVFERLSKLSEDVLHKMWSMYIAGEYGGMLGTMVKVYKITNSPKHLMAAKLFVNEKLFYPMEQNLDTLEDMHANQHIPQIMGAMDIFSSTGEERYWKIARNFWNIVTKGHTYCIGGVGETEMFHRAGTMTSYLTEKAAESCASYNLLRLTGQIFEYVPEGKLMDYYDNTLRNHILTSCSHQPDGGTTYFMPLGPGECKEYSTTENTCCHGTGMESRFRYMEHLYAYDEEYFYINLFIPSQSFGVEEVKLEKIGSNTIKITCLKDMKHKMKIHLPNWSNDKYKIYMNGVEKKETKLEKGYLTFNEFAKKDDEIYLELSMELHVVQHTSDKEMVNIAYGPYILALISPQKDFIEAPVLSEIEKTEKEFCFTYHGMPLIPFSTVDVEPHHVYFRR